MIKQFVFNHFGVNCYVVVDEGSNECAIIDPAMEYDAEGDRLFQYVASRQLTPTLLLLTHAHVDHICGLRRAVSRYGLPVAMHPDGVKLLRQAEAYGSVMGFDVEAMDDLATTPLGDGTVLHVGDTEIRCLHVPGHCPGSICYVIPGEGCVATGDALFQGSVGRTDLPGGNHEELIASLRAKVMTLPDSYIVLPGHGGQSVIHDEKLYNPFL